MGMMKNLHIDWLDEQDEKKKAQRKTQRDLKISRSLTGGDVYKLKTKTKGKSNV